MTTYRMRIGKDSYAVTIHDDGNTTYDPPLPEHVERQFKDKEGEVIKTGQCPKIRGDTDFHRGRMTIREQFKDDLPYLRRFQREYKKQTGMSLPDNAVYMSQLAEGRFDAKAVIRPTQGQAEVDKLIARKAEKHRKKTDHPVALAEDLVQKGMRSYRAQGDTSPDTELRKKVIERHGRKV